MQVLYCCSGKATDTDVQQSVQEPRGLHRQGVPSGGLERILPLLHYAASHELAFPGYNLIYVLALGTEVLVLQNEFGILK